MDITILLAVIGGLGITYILSGFKVIPLTHRGFVQKGKRLIFKTPGTVFVAPFFQSIKDLDITETKLVVTNLPVLTKDKIQCNIDVDVYYKINEQEESVYAMLYESNSYTITIKDRIKADIYDVIGNYNLNEIPNSKLKIKSEIKNNLMEVSKFYYITKIDYKKLILPKEIQESIDKVVEVNNEKIAAEEKIKLEKEKTKKLEEIEKEKTRVLKENLKKQEEMIKKHNEELAKSKIEAVELVSESINKHLKTSQKELKKTFQTAKDKAITNIAEDKNE